MEDAGVGGAADGLGPEWRIERVDECGRAYPGYDGRPGAGNMIRTAIFAGAVLNLMACGQPDAANDRNDETRSAGAPTAAQQILEVDTNAGRQVVGGEEYSFDHAVADYDRRMVLASEAGDPVAVTAYSLDDGSLQHVLGGVGRETVRANSEA